LNKYPVISRKRKTAVDGDEIFYIMRTSSAAAGFSGDVEGSGSFEDVEK